jgi:hypothetical protein
MKMSFPVPTGSANKTNLPEWFKKAWAKRESEKALLKEQSKVLKQKLIEQKRREKRVQLILRAYSSITQEQTKEKSWFASFFCCGCLFESSND